MRSGDPFTKLVEFTEGFPDGNITWTLLDGEGTQIATGTVTPVAASVSAVITISGTNNTLTGGALYGYRELAWNYLVGGNRIASYERYRVEAFLKFGVTPSGVRRKLGLEKEEVEDEDIDLISAYADFETAVTATSLAAVTDASAKLLIGNAIEALAGLRLLPSLQVKLAHKEVSGASQFQRASSIKWDELAALLNEMIAAGYTAANATFDSTANFGSIFVVAPRTPDPVTGEA